MSTSLPFKSNPVDVKRAAQRIPEIVDVVARECVTTREELLGGARDKHTVRYRHMLFAVLQAAGNNCSVIAKYTGLNHSTVLHGVERVETVESLQRDYQLLLLKVIPSMFPLDDALRSATDRLGSTGAAALSFLHVDILGDLFGHSWYAMFRLGGMYALIADKAVFTQVREVLIAHNLLGPLYLLDKHTKPYLVLTA